MNYYDELGVRHNATDREIRHASRVLVRLLHPDRQIGDDLRLAAERQLSRLNEMLELLTNPESRAAYDLSLRREHRRGIPEFERTALLGRRVGLDLFPVQTTRDSRVTRFAVKYWALILVGLVISCALVLSTLLHATNQPDVELHKARIQPPPAAAAPLPGAARKSQAVPKLPEPIFGEPEATASGSKHRAMAAPETESNPAELPLPPGLSSAELSGTLLAGSFEPGYRLIKPATGPISDFVSTALVQPASFAGNWLYTRDLTSPQEGGGYRAIFVELAISETDGALSGDYRARYVVPDRAISPNVEFHLRGQISQEREARVEWAAANGARGAAELHLAGPDIIEFHWWSTKLGGHLALSSGTAKLVRHRIP